MMKMKARKTSVKTFAWIAITVIILGLLVFFLRGGQGITEDLVEAGSIYDTSPHNHLHGIGYDSSNNKLYLATHFGLYILKNDERLYWIEGTTDDYMGFSLNQRNPNVIYTSGHPSFGGNLGVMKTTDAGKTWERIFTNVGPGSVDFHSMTISLVDENVLAGHYRGNIYVTEDAGYNWRITRASPPQGMCWGSPCLVADTMDRENIYAGTLQGLYKTNNLGNSWQQVSQGAFGGVAVHPDNNNILYSFRNGQVVKSEDKGETWTPKSEGISILGNEIVFAFSFDITNPDNIYAATTGQKVYKTNNRGEAWVRII